MGTPDRNKALRRALFPQVEILVDALVAQGMGRDEALRSIRWATYRMTETEAPARRAVNVFGGQGVQP